MATEQSSDHQIQKEAGLSVSGPATEIDVVVKNTQGLHARPAAQFVRIASKYPTVELTVSKGTLSVNGKSIIGIMMLAAGPGTTLNLRAQGEGAERLLEDLKSLIDSRFGEDGAA